MKYWIASSLLFCSLQALAGGRDDIVPPGPRPKAAEVRTPVKDAVNVNILGKAQADGRRVISLVRADNKVVPFLDDASFFAIDAKGYADASGNIMVCTPGTIGRPGLETSKFQFRCGVVAATGQNFGSQVTVAESPQTFLHDACRTGTGFVALYSVGADPIYNDARACRSKSWTAKTGWVDGTEKACSCKILNGTSCSDPCFLEKGTWQDGVCKGDFKTPACTTTDPTMEPYCTGIETNLCVNHKK